MSSQTDTTEIRTREKRYEKAFTTILKNRSKLMASQYGAYYTAICTIPHPDTGYISTR